MHESADEHALQRILGHNEELAAHNREHFEEMNTWTVNLMSAPGAGKTSLLESTIAKHCKQFCCRVIEGDMVGQLDAERLQKLGVDVHQISTGRSCHLDAQMIARLLHVQNFNKTDFLFIENVGNLVCPAEFPLGEHKRVVLLSVTEGDDKPLKYPVIFHQCDAVIFTKCDLLPYVKFDIKAATEYVRNLNPQVRTFAVSTVSGEGLEEWYLWLQTGLETYRKQLAQSPKATTR